MYNIKQAISFFLTPMVLAPLVLVSWMQASPAKVEESVGWVKVEERARNAVVQVLTQGTEFNWFEPYKSPGQRGSRGTAFFIDKEGHLLTNYHVVEGAQSLYVTVPAMGRKQLDVELIGVCPDLDIALLKLTPESYKSVIADCGPINWLEFGDSDKLRSPQEVLVIGFSLGISSVKNTLGNFGGRDFKGGRSYLHTTAPINPGNSGGPLLDIDSKVMSVVVSSVVNAQNYNYFIPINDILIVLPDLYKQRFVRRPEFGAGINRGTAAHARSLQNPLPAGVFVNYANKNSIADHAGLSVGDMIYEISINDDRYLVDEFGEVGVPWRQNQKVSIVELVSRCRLGDKIGFLVYRQGKKLNLHVSFEQSSLKPIRYIYPEFEQKEIDYEMFGGIVIMQLRDNHIQELKSVRELQNLRSFREFDRPENQDQPALVITNVLPGSQAILTECLVPGLILEKVNGKTVSTLDELRTALMLSVKSGEVSIETKDRYATVLDLERVVQDEERLAQAFMFPITKTMRSIITQASKLKKQQSR